MSCSVKRKCINCLIFFKPNPCSKGRQNYCSRLECQKVSKHASQQKWLQKKENQDYFCGAVNVRRVQIWRAKNPGYSKKSKPPKKEALQDALQDTLQDPLKVAIASQPYVLMGLISHLIGATEQEDVIRTNNKLRQLGEDLLSTHKTHVGTHNNIQTPLDRSKPPNRPGG